MSTATHALGTLFDGAPDLLDGFTSAPTAARIIPMPAPRKTLGEHLAGVDLILEALDQLDAEDVTEARTLELSEDLISALAGTREKVDNVNRVLAMFEGLEASAEAEIARLAARVARFARQRERLTDYVLATMTASGLKQLDGDTVTLKLRTNPVKVAIEDPDAIPDKFLRWKAPPPPEPNKDLIKSELKAGREVAGARLVQTTRLERK
jgi:hypothetical protein